MVMMAPAGYSSKKLSALHVLGRCPITTPVIDSRWSLQGMFGMND